MNKTPIIFTIRSHDQGGFFNYNTNKNSKEAEYYKTIKKQILKYGIEYIDIEFRNENICFIQNFYKATKEYNTSVILSNHYLESSIKNDLAQIKKSVFTMSLLYSDVLKLITNFDSFSLNKKEFLELKLFMDNLIKKPLIFFQLGEAEGKLTRLANSFFLPVYDSNLALPTGKGQLSLEEIEVLRRSFLYKEDFAFRHKKRFDYKVIGTSVAFSPSPRIYQECVEFLESKGKLESDFNVEFGFQNINYEEFLTNNFNENSNKSSTSSANITSNFSGKKLNMDSDKNLDLKIKFEENTKELEVNNNNKASFEASEFYSLLFNNNKLLFASITIPFKTLLIDLHSGAESRFKDFYSNKKNKTISDAISYSSRCEAKNKLIFSEETLKMNSVNCIKKVNNDRIMCFNTDWIGNYEIIVELLQKINKDLSAVKILVLGAGGASNAILFSLQQFNFLNKNIFIENRSRPKALLLAKKFNLNLFNNKLNEKKKIKFDIVISTIPKDCEVHILEALLDNVCERTVLVDLAYTKPGSGLITNFKKVLGCKSDKYVDGILFLFKQAYYSFELFYAKICPRGMLQEVFLNLQK